MDSLLRELRQAVRHLRQGGWSFLLTATAALALGIGANTAIFSLVNAVLLKEPPFPQAERLVMLQTKAPQGSSNGASPAKFAHWARQSYLEDVAAFGGGVVNWTGGALPRQLRSAQVSAAYFRLFGVPMLMGRGFNAAEDTPGASAVAVISESFWRGRMGSDSHVVGRTMLLGGVPHVVTGVVADRFDFRDFGPAPEVWVPFQLDPNSRDQGHYFQAAARLGPGINLQQAQVRLDGSAKEYRQRFPDGLDNKETFSAMTLKESLVRGARKSVWVLTAAVVFVLLIACANVANLLLARAEARKREFAIRAALGSGRWRIIRQLLTESFLLASAGAVAGLALGWLGMRALLAVNTAGLPRVGVDGTAVPLDWRVLLFTVALTLVTSLLFGLFPALRSARTDLNTTIKESANRTGSGFRQNQARTMLVVAEVALSLMLLVGAGLLIRTAVAIYSVKPGFDTGHVLTMRMSLAGNSYNTGAAIESLVRRATERIDGIPGVELASATCCIPLEGGYGLPFRVVERPLDKGPFHGGGGWKTISPGFFEVFRIPIVRGRTLNDRDHHGGPPVVFINESMARRFWPKSDPLQDKILIGKGVMPALDDEQPRQIVGIVADQRDGGLNQDPGPEMFIPNGQATDAIQALNVKLTPLAWVVRTRGEPMAVRAAVEEQLRRVTGLPVSDVRTMEQVVSRSTSRERFHMLLMTVFGGVSLVLAAIGIYGLMAFSVEQRTQEIGIRMALGAQQADVRRMVLRQGLTFAAAGIVLGLAGAFALTKQLASFLYGVAAWDPLVFIVIPVALLVTALLAVWWPAARATLVEPSTALRQS